MDRPRPPLPRLVVACALLGTLASCELPAPRHRAPSTPDVAFLAADLRSEVLRAHMQELAPLFAGVIERTADAIEAETTDPQVYSNALRWKTQTVPAVQLAALRMEPVAALLDLWSFTVQMHLFFTDGAGREVFGAQQPMAVEASQRLLREITAVARSASDPDEFQAAEQGTFDWAADHPLQDLTFARDSIIPDFADHSTRSQDVFGSLGTLEDVALAWEQSFSILAASLPRQARWQAELLLHDLLREPEVVALLDTADDASAFMERMPELIDGSVLALKETAAFEREAAVAELRAERALLLEDVERQRLETLEIVTGELQAERALMLADVERQRLETLEVVQAELEAMRALITAERTAALLEADALTRRAIESAETTMGRSVERLLLGLAAIALAGLLLATIAIRIGRRIA
jgi:hypothetical protein